MQDVPTTIKRAASKTDFKQVTIKVKYIKFERVVVMSNKQITENGFCKNNSKF
jgi:hypothetical protein